MAAEPNPQDAHPHNNDRREVAETLSSVQAARRLLLRAGVGSAPALLTVVSPSVLAGGTSGGGGYVCTPPSSFASINASRPRHTYTCTGRKPAYWQSSSSYANWPSGCRPKTVSTTEPATKFDDIFGTSGGFPGKTLLDVLNFGDTGRNGVAKHCVAAYLNAVKSYTPSAALGVTAVKQIWSDYNAKGYFEPTAGTRWYPDSSTPSPTDGSSAGITVYLQSTMPLSS